MEDKHVNKSISDTFNKCFQHQINYFEYLNSLSASAGSDENNKLLKKLKITILNYFHIKMFSMSKTGVDTNFVNIIIDILTKLYQMYVKIYDVNTDTERGEFYTVLLDIVNMIVPDTCTILNCISFDSIKFCNKFVELKGLSVLFEYINNPVLLQSYVKYSADLNSENFYNIDRTMRRIIGSLVCIARVYGNYKNDWKECNAATSFLKYCAITKDIVDNKIYACMASAFVADDDDINTLPDLKYIIPDLVMLVGMASKMIKKNDHLYRHRMDLGDGENESVEVCCVPYLDTQWSLINLLKALYHLGVHDKLKCEIYFKNNMNQYLKVLIFNGNSVEQEYSLNLVWQLCYDKRISQDII